MEIEISRIDSKASKYDVKQEIAKFLHRDEFSKGLLNRENSNLRSLNFQVDLNEGVGGIGTHNGTGKLTLPSQIVGQKFFRILLKDKSHSIAVNGRELLFRKSPNKPPTYVSKTLDRTPYIEPKNEEELEEKLAKLDVGIHIDKVQFGSFFLDPGDSERAPRKFSNEFEISHRHKGAGLLQFEYLHKLIRVQLGDPVTEQIAHNIAISFVNINKMAIGVDVGNPFVCFDLFTPAIFQEEEFNRQLTGDKDDDKKFRKRVDSVHPGHKAVAAYAHHLRFVLHDTRDLDLFEGLCKVAGLSRPYKAVIEGSRRQFFSDKNIHIVRKWLLECTFPVAFQIEALLRNGLVNTDELLKSLKAPIDKLRKATGIDTGNILQHLTEKLRNRTRAQSVLDCLELACEGHDVGGIFPARRNKIPGTPIKTRRKQREKVDGIFSCYHVTITPSRMIYEGPYAIQSNRVIRKYSEYPDNFIRVDFRDEDRLHLKWTRDVDGETLLRERVGYCLKNGIEVAGRRFDFLAYSNSALREHAVWFVQPLHTPTLPFIDANVIRSGLGDFSNLTSVKLKDGSKGGQPSKYAARLGQAFTATDPSVSIVREQWDEMDDIKLGKTEKSLCTDGVGTISKELGDRIWTTLCEARGGRNDNSVQPSAYQIRFLGYKGVVCVDDNLKGIMMRLRPSMKKFDIPNQNQADIEIARAFERPGVSYLNRPLITILEDRGVEQRAFLDLQNNAIAKIEVSSDTLPTTAEFFKKYSLGSRFYLAYILSCLSSIGMRTPKEKRVDYPFEDIFWDRLILVAKNSLLRDVKYAARIPIPGSYQLVGVADEGAAYKKANCDLGGEIYTLKEGDIFLCVQEPGEEPQFIEGTVTVSRSPTVHPGDVQRVHAIGKPPDGVPCLFRNLRNVVVFPCVGSSQGGGDPQSLPSMLGGGDLDGDLYSVVRLSTLLPTEQVKAASYDSLPTRTLDHEVKIDDVCDFIVEYIDSDILGVLSDRHIVIADQSKYGTMDPSCMKLAQMCSQAVDYPKNGNKVNFKDIPRQLIRYKPDWKKTDDAISRETDYYESTKALGVLFRNVGLLSRPKSLQETLKTAHRPPPLSDPISIALQPKVERRLGRFHNSDESVSDLLPLFHHYARELSYISHTHALSDSPDSRLDEEEIVIGTILANCSDNRYRKDRMYRMGLHCGVLTREIRENLYTPEESPTLRGLEEGLSRAWLAWDFGMRNRLIFGANSFAILALGVVCYMLEEFKDIDPKLNKAREDELHDDDESDTD